MSYSSQGLKKANAASKGPGGPPPFIPMDKIQLVPLEGGIGAKSSGAAIPSSHSPYSSKLVTPQSGGSSRSSTPSQNTPRSGSRTPRSGSVTPRGRRIQLTPRGAFLEYEIPKKSSRSPSPLANRTTSDMLMERLERFKAMKDFSRTNSEISEPQNDALTPEKEEKPLSLEDILTPRGANEVKILHFGRTDQSALLSQSLSSHPPISNESSSAFSKPTTLKKSPRSGADAVKLSMQGGNSVSFQETHHGNKNDETVPLAPPAIWSSGPNNADLETSNSSNSNSVSHRKHSDPQNNNHSTQQAAHDLDHASLPSPSADSLPNVNQSKADSAQPPNAIPESSTTAQPLSPDAPRANAQPQVLAVKKPTPPKLAQSKSVSHIPASHKTADSEKLTENEASKPKPLEPEDILYAGFLHKENRPMGCLPLGKKWVRRYAVIQAGQFQIHPDGDGGGERSPSSNENLDLNFGICVKRERGVKGEFSVHIGRKAYRFKVEGEEEQSKWLTALLEAAGNSSVSSNGVYKGGSHDEMATLTCKLSQCKDAYACNPAQEVATQLLLPRQDLSKHPDRSAVLFGLL